MDALQLFRQGSFSQTRLRSRLDYALNQKALFAAIDSDPALVGAGVVYIDAQFTRVELRPFEPICSIKPIKVILREPPRPVSSLEYAADLSSQPRQSHLVLEAVSAGLSCGAAVLGWVVVFGSTAAIPLTGGGSAALTFITYSAATASTLQCVNSSYRTVNEIWDPAENDRLNSEEWYTNVIIALDVISLGGAAAAGAATIKAVKLLHSQGLTIREAVTRLTRAQRRRLTEEVIRLNHPGASNRMIKFLQRGGKYPKRYTNTQVKEATTRQIKDTFGGLFSFTGSATGGVVRNVAIGIYEEVN